jgi:hypothetical protein
MDWLKLAAGGKLFSGRLAMQVIRGETLRPKPGKINGRR